MENRGVRFVLCLVVVLLAAAAFGPRAEVSADPEHAVMWLILAAITEGPDPIPQVIWDPVRDVDPDLFLNPEGGDRGDGRPDAAFHPETSWPNVVWARDEVTHHDIVYSAWDGANTQWLEIETLIDSASDDVDPRISISDDATIYVIWWDANLERVWMSTRATGIEDWDDPELVTGLLDSGRRPSILEWDGTVLAAYERDAIPSGQEVVVATRIGDGVYTTEVVATTASESPLDVILHDEEGVLWIDWRDSDSEYAYSVYSDTAWTERVTVPWVEDSWTQIEEVRRTIRADVLAD